MKIAFSRISRLGLGGELRSRQLRFRNFSSFFDAGLFLLRNRKKGESLKGYLLSANNIVASNQRYLSFQPTISSLSANNILASSQQNPRFQPTISSLPVNKIIIQIHFRNIRVTIDKQRKRRIWRKLFTGLIKYY